MNIASIRRTFSAATALVSMTMIRNSSTVAATSLQSLRSSFPTVASQPSAPLRHNDDATAGCPQTMCDVIVQQNKDGTATTTHETALSVVVAAPPSAAAAARHPLSFGSWLQPTRVLRCAATFMPYPHHPTSSSSTTTTQSPSVLKEGEARHSTSSRRSTPSSSSDEETTTTNRQQQQQQEKGLEDAATAHTQDGTSTTVLQQAQRDVAFRARLQRTLLEEAPTTIATVPPLTFTQWWKLGVRTAVPFFGFGICDNLIMITVGDLIDTHFGVTLGFSTMVAAGLGQAVSDGSGITIQGMIEACSDKLRLPNPRLTDAQKSLPRVLFWQQVFRTLGIVCGCLCGLIPVILFDTGNRPRLYDQLLGVLPEDQRRALSACATYVTVPEGTALFTYGAEADAMYLLQRGEVEVTGRRDNGTPLVICRESAGATLGVVEMAYHHLCVADVVVVSPNATLVKIDRAHFDKVVHDKAYIQDVVTKHIEEEDSFVVYRARHLRTS